VSLCWTNLATLENAHFINKTIKKISGDGDTRHIYIYIYTRTFSGVHALAVSTPTFTGVFFYPEILNGSRNAEAILVLPALLMFQCS